MISKKLYIPTSTLNFNNIMSSESISPASFYAQRGFGYKRFTKVEPNNLDNRIILYDKYPEFRIKDDELENYPLVIEIDKKFVGKDIILENSGIFFTEETIYLNPFSIHIIFRNENEKISTLSKAEPSIETKMVTVYGNCICIKNETIQSFYFQKTNLKDSEGDISKFISKDLKINKLKGFLYAYILAANKSLSSEVVSLKRQVKDLRNLLSAILTSPDSKASNNQEKQLDSLYCEINITFFNADNELNKIIKQKKEQYQCKNFVDILKNERLFEPWCRGLNLKHPFQIQRFYPSGKTTEEKEQAFEQYISVLETSINGLAGKNQRIAKEYFPILQICRIISIPEQKEFLIKLLNEFLEEAYSSNEFIQSRYEFAKSGGKIFKEEIQDKWEGSLSQRYINALLKNLNEHTAFDIKSDTNLTLQSFAAFCQKGDIDIDKLEDYLISNEIGDFKIAFALWGIVFGFANMPKTLTNDLFLSDDSEYVSEVYKYIFKQVHDIELEGKLVAKKQEEYTTVPSKMNEPQTEHLQQPQTISNDNTNKLKQALMKILTGKDKEKQIQQIMDLLNKNYCQINANLFKDIKDKVSGVGDAKIDKIKTALGFNNVDTSLIKEKKLFVSETTGKFLSDLDFLSSNNDFISIVSNHKDWKKDLKWFIESHSKSHKDFEKYWKNKPTDIESVIKQFIFLKKGIYKGTEALLKSLYLHNE